MLSNADIAILHAVTLQRKFGQDLTPDDFLIMPREQIRPVRPQISENEIMMASAACSIQVWDAPGDGTYATGGAPIVATGFGNSTGTAQMAGMAIGTLAANAFSKSRARKNAVPRWMDFVPQGTLTVSTFGIYVEDATQGLLCWTWSMIQSVEWQAPSRIVLLLSAPEGSVYIALTSDWAELVYVTWIESAFPQHPQKFLYTTADWAERIRSDLGWDPWTSETVSAVAAPQSQPSNEGSQQ